MRNAFWTLLKVGATLAIIAFLLTRVDLGVMKQHLARANVPLLLFALGLYFLAIALGALKWQILTRAQGLPGPLGDLLTYSLVGLFFGNLLPSNVGGDVVRAYGLARASGRAEAAAISVLVDRLMGLFAFLSAAVVMAAVAAATLAHGAELEQVGIATVFVAGVLMLASALLFSRRFSLRLKWIFRIGPLARARPIAQRVYHALQVYRHRLDALLLNGLLSLAIVAVTTLVWYVVARALGLDLSIFYFFLFNPLIAFVLLIPLSFNGLGPKEATAVFFFGLVGVPNEVALSLSLIFHLLIVLASLPGGFLWWRTRLLGPTFWGAPGRGVDALSRSDYHLL